MKKVTIEPGCIACGTCEFIAPQVFKVTDRSRVQPEADIPGNDQLICKAVKSCPVQVIKYQEEQE